MENNLIYFDGSALNNPLFQLNNLTRFPQIPSSTKKFKEAHEALMNIAFKNERDVEDFVLEEEQKYQKLINREQNVLKSVYAQTAIDSYIRK